MDAASRNAGAPSRPATPHGGRSAKSARRARDVSGIDGLFGERNEIAIASARGTSGRLEISGLYSEYEGNKFRVRGNVRFDFPNFAKRWNAFIGRDDQDDFIRDRSEGLALRSQFLDFADENRWPAPLPATCWARWAPT